MSDNHQLYHYGVKGMKWGVIRSRTRLSDRVTRLNRNNEKLTKRVDDLNKAAKNYEAKSSKVNKGNSKYESRLAKATAKKAKYDIKAQKEMSRRHTNIKKLGKYTAKSAKYNTKIMKAQKKLKYNKWYAKAEKTRVAADKAKDKIAKNSKVISTYNNTIDALDMGTIKRGRVFMQYVTG